MSGSYKTISYSSIRAETRRGALDLSSLLEPSDETLAAHSTHRAECAPKASSGATKASELGLAPRLVALRVGQHHPSCRKHYGRATNELKAESAPHMMAEYGSGPNLHHNSRTSMVPPPSRDVFRRHGGRAGRFARRQNLMMLMAESSRSMCITTALRLACSESSACALGSSRCDDPHHSFRAPTVGRVEAPTSGQ